MALDAATTDPPWVIQVPAPSVGFGCLLIGLVGLVVLAIGVLLAREGWTKEFLKRMNFGGAPAGTRSLVEKLGVLGGAPEAR